MTKADVLRRVRRRGPSGGFTMIEVVAAVAILGLWFTLLLRIVSNGVAAETRNQARLEASLIADEALADAESALLAGGAIAPISLGDEHPYGEFADADYDVVVSATPFDPIGSLAPREGAFVPPEGLALDFSKLTPEEQAAATAALLEIRVDVFARSGDGEFDAFDVDGLETLAVASRTSFAIDPIVLETLAGAAGLPGGAPGGGAGGLPSNDRPLGSDQ